MTGADEDRDGPAGGGRPARQGPGGGREARLRAALRANLVRRKARAHAVRPTADLRTGEDAGGPDAGLDASDVAGSDRPDTGALSSDHGAPGAADPATLEPRDD